MVPYLGDFAEDDTVYIMFNTFSSDDPSASVTITNFINTDVHIHKDDDLTQRNNAAGITVSVDFDGITGSHMIKIDTNDNTVATFWVTGSEYFVRIEGTTVDGATINAVVGHFSIERAGGTIALLKLIQAAVITNAAGTDVAADIIAVKAETALIVADTDVIDDGTSGLVKIAADVADILTDTSNTLDTLIKDIPTTAEIALRTLLAAEYTIVTDLGTVQSADNNTLLTAIAGYLDTEIAAIKAVTDLLPDAGALNDLATILTDTNELQTDWINGGRLDLILDAIKVITDALTAVAAAKLALSAGTIVSGTVSHDNTAASTTVFYSDDITEATADHYKSRIVIFTSGALKDQATDIAAYALEAGEGKFTVTALTEAPADNVTFIII